MEFLVQAAEWTKMLSDEDLNASGQNSLNLVLIRYIPAKRDVQPFIKPLGKASAFAKSVAHSPYYIAQCYSRSVYSLPIML